MRRRGRTMPIVLCTLLVLGGAVLGVRLWLGRDAELRVEPGEVADFATLRPSDKANLFVLCPASLCPDTANLPSPNFHMRWQRLRDFWREMVAAQPRVTQVAREEDGRRLVYIQRSAVFRFPDVITVEFLPVGEDRSTLAVMSRSRYGSRDFGVNAARVEAWMALLQQMMRDEERGISSSR